MNQPLISIVLTTFNSEGTITDVLDAILKQNMPLSTIELIVVDGGSRDQTIEIAKSFMEKYGSLFYNAKLIVHDKNYGLSKARNDGIKASCGKYVLVLDDDVVMRESTLANLLKFLENSPSNVAAVIPLLLVYPESTLDRWVRLIRQDRVSRASAITNCALIRKEVIEKIGFYDETLGLPFTMGEEIEYYARTKSRGYEALIDGFEKVLHVIDERAWRKKVDEFPTSTKLEGGKRRLLDVLRRAFSAVKSISNSPYRYAYKKYVANLPFSDKLRWYTYLATISFIVLLIVLVFASSILDTLTLVTQPIALISLILCLVLYVDTLREYWNPKVFHISLAYSAVALVWRMLRSMMLLTFMSAKRPDSPYDERRNNKDTRIRN